MVKIHAVLKFHLFPDLRVPKLLSTTISNQRQPHTQLQPSTLSDPISKTLILLILSQSVLLVSRISSRSDFALTFNT